MPYDSVWNLALELARSRAGWSVTASDDIEGMIRVEARTLVLRQVDDVEIRVRLDPDGQTRVDMTSTSRRAGTDLGTNARRVDFFFRALERRLGLR